MAIISLNVKPDVITAVRNPAFVSDSSSHLLIELHGEIKSSKLELKGSYIGSLELVGEKV